MLTRVRRRLADESGVTLIELLVVMLLMGIVGVIVMRSVVAASGASVVGTSRADAIEDMRPAIQRMTRELRAADPIQLSSAGDYGTELAAVVHRGASTFRHRYAVVTTADGVELWEEVHELAADGSEALVRANELVILVDASTQPVFEYLDLQGLPISCTGLDLNDAADDATCRGRLVTASAIGISLTREVLDQDPIVVSTAVNIRNVRYGS